MRSPQRGVESVVFMNRNMELLELPTYDSLTRTAPGQHSSLVDVSYCICTCINLGPALCLAQVTASADGNLYILQDEFLERVVDAAAKRFLHSTRVLPFVRLRVTCASADRSH